MINIGEASYFEHDPEKGIEFLLNSEDLSDFEIFNNNYLALGVDDARFLRDLLGATSTAKKGRLVILGITKATTEAQNALLKILEDLPSGNSVVLVTPDIRNFLPTLRSRLREIVSGFDKKEKIDTKKFLSLYPADRLKMFKNYFVHADSDDEKKERMEETREFLVNLEKELYARNIFHLRPDIAETLFSFKKELRGSAPSVRLILEHLSFFIPVKN